MNGLATAVSAFVRRLLRPVVSITLRCGITFRQFADLVKSVYVEVAMREHGVSGRPATTSRVAMLTGLTRRDAAHQRELLEQMKTPGGDRIHSTARVLMGWHTDPTFSLEDGVPRPLPAEGEVSFFALYQRFSGADIPLSTMLSELLKVGAVKRDENGYLHALTRYFQPVSTDPHAIERAGQVLSDIGQSVRFNIYRGAEQSSRFEGRAWSASIPTSRAADFSAFLQARGQAFLEDIDSWLIDHEQPDDDPADCVRLGVGVYEINTPPTEPAQSGHGEGGDESSSPSPESKEN